MWSIWVNSITFRNHSHFCNRCYCRPLNTTCRKLKPQKFSLRVRHIKHCTDDTLFDPSSEICSTLRRKFVDEELNIRCIVHSCLVYWKQKKSDDTVKIRDPHGFCRDLVTVTSVWIPRITINLDTLIWLSESSLLGCFLEVSLIVIIKVAGVSIIDRDNKSRELLIITW